MRWRVNANVGLHGLAFSYVAAVGVEREMILLPAGRLSAGARAWVVTGAVPVDDGGGLDGGGSEAQVTWSTGARVVDARAFGAVGLGVLDYFVGGLCEPEFGDVCDEGDFEGVVPYVLGGVGLDVYPVPALGVGAELRVGTSSPLRDLVSAEVGLRVRLGRNLTGGAPRGDFGRARHGGR